MNACSSEYLDIRLYWETCKANYAHLKQNWRVEDKRGKHYHSLFLSKMDLENKTVVEYGCGGGFLGEYLFNKYNIKKYIGVDIAKRSLRVAETTLSGHDCDFVLAPVEFSTLKADAFFSIATIQHFPSKSYLDDFLNNLNKSEIPEIALQFRSGGLNFSNAYVEDRSPGDACKVELKYIYDGLDKYELISHSEVAIKSGGQFSLFRIKNDIK